MAPIKITGMILALLLSTTKGKETLFNAYELQFIELKVKNATMASPLVKPEVRDYPDPKRITADTPMAAAY